MDVCEIYKQGDIVVSRERTSSVAAALRLSHEVAGTTAWTWVLAGAGFFAAGARTSSWWSRFRFLGAGAVAADEELAERACASAAALARVRIGAV